MDDGRDRRFGPTSTSSSSGRLAPGEHEALWQDYIRFGELFGMPREVAPPTHAEFREYFEGYLAGDHAHLTDAAREIGYATAMEIPMPGYYEPAKRLHDLIMLGSLPPVVRRHYGLGWSSAQSAAFRLATTAIRASRPITPGAIRYGYNTASFRLVASTERRRLERGEPTPQVV